MVYKEQSPFQQSEEELAAIKEWLKTQPPGTRVESPSTVSTYNFVLFSDGGKKRQKVWSRSVEGFEAGPYSTQISVLDAIYESGVLIVAYKQVNATFAVIVRPDPSGRKNQWLAMPWPDSKLLADEDFHQKVTTAAKISGSLKEGTLSVELKDQRKKMYKFLLVKEKDKEKWVEEKQEIQSTATPNTPNPKDKDAENTAPK